MDRRLFVRGLLGVAGTTAVAAVLPRQTKALAAISPVEADAPPSDFLPKLDAPAVEPGDLAIDDLHESVELAWHEGHWHRRRRRRARRWRRVCRRYWHNGRWRRRCRRRPFWIWIWIG
jgi:hypothetical protein